MLSLIFPDQCPCGEWDVPACDACLETIDRLVEVTDLCPRLIDHSGHALWPTWAMSDYLGPAGPLIRAWKSEPNLRLTRAMTAVITRCVATSSPLNIDRAVIVPAPSAPSRYRQGTYIAGHIADAVAKGLALRGAATISASLLLPRRGHQQGRSARARGRRTPVHVASVKPSGIVLVDDVVTTGATINDCASALGQAGHRLLGTFCVASARRRAIPPEIVCGASH